VPIQRLFERIQKGQTHDVAFDDLCALTGELGFRLERVRDGHWVLLHPALPRAFPLQADSAKARPYQFRQLLRILEKYDLLRRSRT
jgi:hypothetical protein